MSTKNVFVFQGGKRRHIAVAALGDVVTNLSPGAGFRWLVLRAALTLVAVGAANRYFRLELTDGTNIVGIIGGNNTAITAGQTKLLYLGEVKTGTDWNFNDVAATVRAGATIDPILLEGADQFRITINGGLGADNYSGTVTVLEMKL